MKQRFTEAVGAVSPLNGAIDGSPRKKPRRARKPPREPMARSLTFFCSNPRCDHATWSPQDQARHMAGEYWNLAKAVVRLAPDSPEALALTGGRLLNDLTDGECRVAAATYRQHQRRGDLGSLSPQVRLWFNEFQRRCQAGTIAPLADAGRDKGRFSRTEDAAQRDAEAAALRREGWTYQRIADELGFASKGNAHDAVQRASLDGPGTRARAS